VREDKGKDFIQLIELLLPLHMSE